MGPQEPEIVELESMDVLGVLGLITFCVPIVAG